MRPAQKAPENYSEELKDLFCLCCFNEAGAKSAGKPRSANARCPPSTGFNEAGAKSAGKHLQPPGLRPEDRASMRPAQKAPENFEVFMSRLKWSGCFNEAGAKSAGKLVWPLSVSLFMLSLQ